MANSNGWGDGAANNSIGWGQGANNAIAWGDSHAKSWAGATDIVGLTTDPDAQAFITAAAITDPTQQTAIDTLVKGMKADGLWTKMKAIYPFVGGTASAHKWNLKDPRDLDAAFRLVFNGGWTHSANGATPNGTNGYADTKLSPLSVLSQNSISGGVYVNSDAPSGNINRTDVLFGASASAGTGFSNGFYSLPIASSDSRDYSRANTNLGPGTPSWANGKAFFQIYRTSSTIFTARRNTTTVNHQIGSVAPTANNIWLSGLNAAGVLTEQSSNRIALTYFGDGLTDTEAANLYTRVQAFQTALSRQV